MVKRILTKRNIIILAFILAVITALILYVKSAGFTVESEEIIFEIHEGWYFNDIADALHKENIISDRTLFSIYGRLFHSDEISSVITGKIKIEGRRSYKKLYSLICSDERYKEIIKVTVPEGYNISEIKELLLSFKLIESDKFDEAVYGYDFNYDFIKESEKKENRLEGFLFPDTYYFTDDDNEITIINAMLKRFQEVTEKYKADLSKSGFTLYEAVTLASIIEKESTASDYGKVSSVFNNRLKRSDNLKFLQSCATVQYILKEKKPILSNSDIMIDSPYNTYKYPGLPIGPIASPGEKAFYAALNPDKTDYLYFQNDKDGNLHFTADYNEHLKNMEKFQ